MEIKSKIKCNRCGCTDITFTEISGHYFSYGSFMPIYCPACYVLLTTLNTSTLETLK